MYILYHYIIHYHHHYHHDAVSPGFYSGDDFPQRDLRFFFRTRVRGRTFPHLFTASKENPQDSVEFAEPNLGFHVNLPLFINPFWDYVMMGGVLGTKTRHPGKGIRWDGLRQANTISYIYMCVYTIYIYNMYIYICIDIHMVQTMFKLGLKFQLGINNRNMWCPFLGPYSGGVRSRNGGWDY